MLAQKAAGHYYGPLLPGMDFTPAPGMEVTAWVDGNLCGRGETLDIHGSSLQLNVSAASPGAARVRRIRTHVHFRVSDFVMPPRPYGTPNRLGTCR